MMTMKLIYRSTTRLCRSVLLAVTILALAQGLSAQVQVAQFGYLSYNDVYRQMPEFAQAEEAFATLKAKYDAEATRAEEDFQRKFAEFLQGQKDFPPSIMQKRQAELQDLMDKSVSFRQQTQELLRKAQEELQRPVAERLDQAIQTVGAQLGLIFVLNTDGNSVPFIHPQVGVNVTRPVLIELGLLSDLLPVPTGQTAPEVPQQPDSQEAEPDPQTTEETAPTPQTMEESEIPSAE